MIAAAWQDVAAFAAVFVALSFVAWRWRARADRPGCDGCGQARVTPPPPPVGRVRLPVVSR